MRFSKKSDYALRALVHLAQSYERGPQSIRALADDNDIPYRFLQQIMLDLKARGWVRTHVGRHGGVSLAKAPRAITMGEVVRHLDGVLAPTGCVSITNYEACSQEQKCFFRRSLLDIRNYTAALLDRTTLSMLIQGVPPSRTEVFDMQFIDGGGI